MRGQERQDTKVLILTISQEPRCHICIFPSVYKSWGRIVHMNGTVQVSESEGGKQVCNLLASEETMKQI